MFVLNSSPSVQLYAVQMIFKVLKYGVGKQKEDLLH